MNIKIICLLLIVSFSNNLYAQNEKRVNKGFFGKKLIYANGEFGIVKSNKNELWGIKNEEKPKKTKYEYQSLHYLHLKNKAYYLAKKDDKWGVIDNNNKEILPFHYSKFMRSSNCECFILKHNDKWGILDYQFNELLPVEYDDFWIKGDKIMVKRNGKWGMIKKTGEKLIPIEYEDLVYAKNNSRYIAKKSNKYGVINDSFKLVLPTIYDEIQDLKISYNKKHKRKFNEPLELFFLLKKDGKFGISDGNGIVEQETIYDTIKLLDHNRFNENYFILKKNNKYGLCALQKKELILECKYEEIKTILIDAITYFLLKKDNLYGILKKDGRPFYRFTLASVVANIPTFEHPHYIIPSSSVAIIKEDNKWGAIDKNQTLLLPIEFDSLYVGQRFFIGKKKDKLGVFNLKCENILPLEYDSISSKSKGHYFPEHLLLVKKDHKLGYAKLDGTFLIPPKYDVLKGFSDGLARVQLDGKWGFVDTNGAETIELIYDAAKPFTFGKSQVQLNGKTFYIDKTGKEINSPY